MAIVGSKMQSVVLPNLVNALEIESNYMMTGLGGGFGGGVGSGQKELTEEELLRQQNVISGVFGLTAVYFI